jgi:hypothetical protein
MKARIRPIIDDCCYSVVGINGYRKGNLFREEALDHAARLVEDMKQAGWRGLVRVHYRDGSEVWKGGTP